MKHIRLFIFALAAFMGQFAHAQATGQPGQPAPFTAIQIAGSDGTTLRTVKTDANGVVAVGGGTAAGNAASGAGNPQVIAGTTTYNGAGNVSVPVVSALGSMFVAAVGSGSDVDNPTAVQFINTAGNNASPSTTNHIFDGTNYPRSRSASLANYPTATTTTARNSIGATVVENGSRFAVNSAPAVSTQASASIAAEASVRHVVTAVCFSAGATTAPTATSMQINIRDGATGAGTVLTSFEVSLPASTGVLLAPTCVPIGPLVGTTNTAMTAEWNALLTNVKQTATLIGFNIN